MLRSSEEPLLPIRNAFSMWQKRCIEDYEKENDVVVVLSAMEKYTDELD